MDDANPPDKASEWLTAFLERPGDAALRERFRRWLDADPGNAADWAEIARTYEILGRTRPAHRDQWKGYAAKRRGQRRLPEVPASQARSPDARRTRPNARLRLSRVVAGMAAAALAACLILTVAPNILPRLVADHVTATAEVRTVRLADGSIVRLGPESAIDVAYDGMARTVRLRQGRAFFEVAPDPARPFRVRASLVDATALGTAFEVRVDGRGAGVAVRHGIVHVDGRGGGSLLSEGLGTGDWMTMTWSGEAARGTLPPEQVAAWLQGRLVAKDRPVGDVVYELQRYYHGAVILRGDGLAEQPLTGVYDLTDPVTALRAVASALGATPYQISPWVFVIAGG